MLTVHHLNNSRSQRVLWLLEELGVPYELVRYQRGPDQRAPAELRKVHPLGLSPVLTDGEGLVLAETGAIVTWLLHRFDPEHRFSIAPDSPAWPDYLYWMFASEGTVMPPLVMSLVMSVTAKQAPFFIRPVAGAIRKGLEAKFYGPKIRDNFAYAESAVGKSGWFAGVAFGAADVMMSFPVEAAKSRVGLSDFPALRGWLDRIQARPAYQAALARGGKYDYA